MQRSALNPLWPESPAIAATLDRHGETADERRERINAELVHLLYAQAPLGIASTLTVAGLTAFSHWGLISATIVIGWFLLHLVVNSVRLLLIQAYRSRSSSEHRRWGHWYTLTSAGSGLAWGSSVVLIALSGSTSHQYFAALVVSGVVSGALAILSAVRAAYAAFSVLALLPVAIWFLLQGDSIYLLMGLLGILLLAVLLSTARRLHDILVQSLELSFSNAELAQTVSAAWDEAVKVNRELEREVVARRRIETWLKREKDRAQTTLKSLGDAMITTDASCRVDYVNPAAEQLTGWTLGDAHGRPLEDVFRLRDEGDHRNDVNDPVRHCLSAAVTHGFGEGMLRRQDDQEVAIQHSWAPIRSPEAEPSGSVIIIRERDAECSGREQLSFQDTHDLKTGLPNRRGFEEHLLRAANSARSDNLEHVLVSLSLGDYDVVVDQYGDEAGQELAIRFSKLLQSQVRGADAIARLADNRFGILLACCSMESARSLVENLKLAIAGFRFAWGNEERAVSPTVGITPINGTSQVHFLLDR